MATLLTICQFVAGDIGVLVPLSIVGNPDVTATGLLRQASRACRRVQAEIDWPILIREHTFPAVDGTDEYALPSDFDRFIDDTAWDRTAFWAMRGPLSAQEWQVAKSGLIASAGLRKRWRVKRAAASVGNKFVIDPTPTDTNSLVFEYISNSWATAADGTTLRTDWVADTDILLLDEDLVELDMAWRMLKRLGRGYKDEKQEADRAVDQIKAQQGGMPTLSVTAPRFGRRYPNVPETGYGS